MTVLLRKEIAFMKKILMNNNLILITPFAYIVPQDHDYKAAANACNHYGGVWSIELLYIFHLFFS